MSEPPTNPDLHQRPAGGEYYVFRDAVHNLIAIEEEQEGKLLRSLLETKELQRLRHIKQNGLTFYVYPSLETSRFPHALGSYHIARRIATSLQHRQPGLEEGFPLSLRITDQDCLAFSLAALLHDIGHGPLSHLWEEVAENLPAGRSTHEVRSLQIIQSQETQVGKFLHDLTRQAKHATLLSDVVALLQQKHHLRYLHQLLSGNLDIDRLDFVARDTRAAGVTYGSHDLDWIIRSLRFARLPANTKNNGRWVVAVDGRKGLNALVQFLQARDNMYRLVYHHKTTRCLSVMLRLLVERTRDSTDANLFSFSSAGFASDLRTRDETKISDFVDLDDSDVFYHLKFWSNRSTDPLVRDISERIISRRSYKGIVLQKSTFDLLKRIDSVEFGHHIAKIVSSRLGIAEKDAYYYYALDHVHHRIVGKQSVDDDNTVWIMKAGTLGFVFETLENYWRENIQSEMEIHQYMLVMHPAAANDLAQLVDQLSRNVEPIESGVLHPPNDYGVLARLPGAEGAWKQAYVGASKRPGAGPENVVALKRYKGDVAVTSRDIAIPNLLIPKAEELSLSTQLSGSGADTWISEGLWTGSLQDFLHSNGPLRNLTGLLDIACDLFRGLSIVHSQNLRHTDLKLDNCGVRLIGKTKRKYLVGDFGCMSTTPESIPEDSRLLGTLRTRAPEVLASPKRIGLPSDVWALAATVVALASGKYPFVPVDMPHGNTEERKLLEQSLGEDLESRVESYRRACEDSLPPVVWACLSGCLVGMESRLTAQDALDKLEGARTRLRDAGPQGAWAWQRATDVLSAIDENPAMAHLQTPSRFRNEALELLEKCESYIPPDCFERLSLHVRK